jgi:hypothetical protein
MKSGVGTIRNGHVEFEKPIEWQSGPRVRVIPEEEPFGIPEEDWPTTPEGIRELLAKIDALEPLELTRRMRLKSRPHARRSSELHWTPFAKRWGSNNGKCGRDIPG